MIWVYAFCFVRYLMYVLPPPPPPEPLDSYGTLRIRGTNTSATTWASSARQLMKNFAAFVSAPTSYSMPQQTNAASGKDAHRFVPVSCTRLTLDTCSVLAGGYACSAVAKHTCYCSIPSSLECIAHGACMVQMSTLCPNAGVVGQSVTIRLLNALALAPFKSGDCASA